MTNKEILKKAIHKVIENGCIHYEQVLDYLPTYRIQYNEHYSLIFDNRFAKAFWGNKTYKTIFYCGIDHPCKYEKKANEIGYENGGTSYCKKCNDFAKDYDTVIDNEGWRYHLQQMVLEEDPIKYLESFL